jgi:hypothetical protein
MHKLDQLFTTYNRRIAFGTVLMVVLGASVWIGQIRVGSVMLAMKSTADLFSLAQGSVVSSMFATRFFAAFLSGAFTWRNLLASLLQSLRFAGLLWILVIVYLSTLKPTSTLQKGIRWSALLVSALQGILYILVFYSLYAAYNAGSGSEAAARLSFLGFSMILCSWIEAIAATSAALLSLFIVHREEIG